jgi:DNA modification methylase
VNTLHYGDNLDILRRDIADESVDLIYLDPPFNSNATFNVLFSSPKGHKSNAQIEAFEDTWHWGPEAEAEFSEIIHSSNTNVAEMMQAMRSFLGENDVMAYLTMMGTRLIQLHRVLKPTGSIYLHCDPTASHYLKVLLDAIFDHNGFRNEIVWKRTPFSGSSKARAQQFPRSHDIILFYTKGSSWTWNGPTEPYSEKYLGRFKWNDHDGRGPYRKTLLKTYSTETFERLERENILILPQHEGAKYSYKQYLNTSSGTTQIDDVWTSINALNPVAHERLGYPTQKPLALLERIIEASSNPGEVVLDPFCGCGTAVHAAQKLGRHWIGIDITSLAVGLIEKRLKDAFPAIQFSVEGTPVDLEGARDLSARDKYQFQWWACTLVDAQPYQGKKKGADGGIDGLIFFDDEKGKAKKLIVSVKGGENVGLTMVKELIATVQGEKAEMGLFVTLTPPTRPMIAEAARAGYYDSPLGKSYPRIQLLTIDGLMAGRERPLYPLSESGGLTFKRAKVELKNTKQRDLFERGSADVAALPFSALIEDGPEDKS